MELRNGITHAGAIKAIQACCNSSTTLQHHEHHVARSRYLRWVDETDRQLRNIFVDSTQSEALYTVRYWYLAEGRDLILPSGHVDWGPLVREQEVQVERLWELTARMKALSERVEGPGAINVLDANAYIEATMFDQVDWRTELGEEQVRLVLPYAVLVELDEKKHDRNERVSRRAYKVVRALDQYIPQLAKGGRAEIRARVTIELLPEERGHRRAPITDQEIVDQAVLLSQYSGRPVQIITDDRHMRLRALSYGLDVWPIPDRLLLERNRPKPDGS
ncbi:PIN domain-containing protein [Actinomadura sp. 3N508]|uniref:PIN domain-containing protein n=1 Tax=Actinomadura sp. 3N508 TaxID=3375153 RepID=UPI003798193A